MMHGYMPSDILGLLIIAFVSCLPTASMLNNVDLYSANRGASHQDAVRAMGSHNYAVTANNRHRTATQGKNDEVENINEEASFLDKEEVEEIRDDEAVIEDNDDEMSESKNEESNDEIVTHHQQSVTSVNEGQHNKGKVRVASEQQFLAAERAMKKDMKKTAMRQAEYIADILKRRRAASEARRELQKFENIAKMAHYYGKMNAKEDTWKTKKGKGDKPKGKKSSKAEHMEDVELDKATKAVRYQEKLKEKEAAWNDKKAKEVSSTFSSFANSLKSPPSGNGGLNDFFQKLKGDK